MNNNNKLDISVVKRQIFMCYTEIEKEGYGLSWDMKDYFSFFRMYYTKYRQRFNKEHTKLTNAQITEILLAIPSITDAYGYEIELTLAEYPPLIDAYFEQKFNSAWGRCNYSLLHFTSGKIRYYRYVENQFEQEGTE